MKQYIASFILIEYYLNCIVINIINKGYLEAFGKNLKKIRNEKKLSQRELGLKAGIDFNQIGRLERGQQNPTLSTIYIIAKALEISPKSMLDFQFNEKSPHISVKA